VKLLLVKDDVSRPPRCGREQIKAKLQGVKDVTIRKNKQTGEFISIDEMVHAFVDEKVAEGKMIEAVRDDLLAQRFPVPEARHDGPLPHSPKRQARRALLTRRRAKLQGASDGR